jgi:quercetin dioxygenase-like cupin family protein
MSITSADRSIYSPLQRDRVTFLETAAESGGTRTLLEIELAPGGGNAPHRHLTYAERFEVVFGTLTVRLGDDELRLEEGQTATAPIGTIHNFRNDTAETVVFRVSLDPGHRGMEKTLQAGYALQAEGRTDQKGVPRNLLQLAVLLDWSDVGMVGPMRALEPVLGLLLRIARRRGVDRELEQRHVHI